MTYSVDTSKAPDVQDAELQATGVQDAAEGADSEDPA